MTKPVVSPYHLPSAGCSHSLACTLAKMLGYSYVAIFPKQELGDRTQPVYEADEVANAVVTSLGLSPAQVLSMLRNF